jgi:type III restriction enzyme
MDHLRAKFTRDSVFELTPEIVGPTETEMSGIIGRREDIDVKHLENVRDATVIYKLTQYLLERNFTDGDGQPRRYLFGQLKRITAQWFKECLKCKSTFPAQVLYKIIAEEACNRIHQAISLSASENENKPVRAILDPYNKTGSTAYVSFTTSKQRRFTTSPEKCHINYVIGDSDWELMFAAMLDKHPKVLSYVKNQGLGFEVPYQFYAGQRRYIPDFIILVNDGRGKDDPLKIIAEIKGIHGEDAKAKKNTLEALWVPGVNRLGTWGRWTFGEFTDQFSFKDEFNDFIAGVKK